MCLQCAYVHVQLVVDVTQASSKLFHALTKLRQIQILVRRGNVSTLVGA